jgi:hypothetical protein
MTRIKYFLALSALALTSAATAAEKSDFQNRMLSVIDIPTAEVVDHYGYNVSFRFGQEGGIQNKTIFGVFPRLNIGFGLDTERLIGNDKDPRLNKPTINVKFRLFDGKGVIPALALGYDGQGYHYNKDLGKYNQREKGFYLVGTEEILVPNLMVHLGANVPDFDQSHPVRGFVGASYVYEQTAGLLFEYDQGTEWKERRINYGLRLYITPLFTIDLAGRYAPVTYGEEEHETERIVILGYTGTF